MRANVPKPASHLRRGYLLRNPLLWGYLRSTDALLRGVAALHRAPAPPLTAAHPPRKVLLAIGGQLGDAIIATSALELLRAALPHAELGVAIPSWSRVVFDGDPRIRRLHTVDHWRPNRRPVPLRERLDQYRGTWRTAVEEVRAAGYDAAFDLYPYYPNMAGLLWRAGIPHRFGFTTGGRGPLYTGTIPWTDDRCHIAEKQARLIRSAIPWAADESPAVRLPAPGDAAARRAADLLAERAENGFVILHPGSGSRAKDWPAAAWRELATRLADRTALVVTGSAGEEARIAERIVAGLPGAASFAGVLDWPTLAAVVAKASLVVSADTSVAHLAAALRVPGIVIHSGVNDMREWRPLGAPEVSLALLSEPVPCAPCYHARGCEAMTCIRGVTVERVVAAVTAALPPRRRPADAAPTTR